MLNIESFEFFVCSMYSTKAVLLAMIITAIVAIIVTIFCFQTKVRFLLKILFTKKLTKQFAC